MPKVLVVGSSGCNLPALHAKVAQLTAAHGFTCCFCVGEFCPADDAGAAASVSETHLDDDAPPSLERLLPSDFAVPVYFICGQRYGLGLEETDDARSMGRNAFYLGRSGVTDIQGIRVAYLSGTFSATAQARNCAEAQALLAQHARSGRIVDVLLTSQFPQGVDVGALPVPFSSDSDSAVSSSSTLISHVASVLCPRYHFTSFSNTAYERAPYLNSPSPSSASFTRFISLADAFNTLGRKFIYAATIVPLHELDTAPPIPEGSTPSPFVAAVAPPPPVPTSRLAKLEAAAAEISAASSYSRWGQPGGQHLGSQGRGGQGGRKRGRNDSNAAAAACWFCLASPEVEKHLIVSVGDESYVALAKGGIDWNNLLIVPIDHVSSTLDLSAEGVADVARYKRRLQSYFASQSPPLEVVFMERNTFTKGAKHAHIQVFAVAAGQGAAIAATIAQYGGAHNLKFDSVDEDWQRHVQGSEYCVMELPEGGGVLLHVVPHGGRFPVSFCREVMCVIMKTPDRVDWKLCACSRDEEEGAAAALKAALEKHTEQQ